MTLPGEARARPSQATNESGTNDSSRRICVGFASGAARRGRSHGALTSNGADHPFDKWILPRGARCGKDLLHPETVDATIEVRSVDLVSTPYQVPRRRVPWKSIGHWLCRPLGRRMFGDIEMNDTATVVAKDDEDEQNSEGCRRQSEKVKRHQVLCMIIEKAPPSMGRWGCDGEPYTWRRRPALVHNSRSRSTIVLYSRIRGSP